MLLVAITSAVLPTTHSVIELWQVLDLWLTSVRPYDCNATLCTFRSKNCQSEGVGLRVWRLRTESLKASDWKFRVSKLMAHDQCGFCLPMPKKGWHKVTLTFSHNEALMPMYKGLRAREGHSFSITSPSLFRFEPSLFCDGSECDPKCEGKVRDNRSSLTSTNALYIRGWMENVKKWG